MPKIVSRDHPFVFLMAKEMEKVALFDFNLTLPSIAAEFQLLMVALEKIYFTPLAEGRKKVEAELAEALQNLERQKKETIKALDSQIAALSDQIVKKVIPTV